MNKRELYALLDIESPEEFEYFENLADYLESAESSTRNFADISIKSPLSDISWGNLNPQ